MKIEIENRELIIKNRQKKDLKDIYDNICENILGMNLNEIHIKYELKEEDNNIRLFGDFFRNFNYNCKIIFNSRIHNIATYLNFIKMSMENTLMKMKEPKGETEEVIIK